MVVFFEEVEDNGLVVGRIKGVRILDEAIM